MKHPSIAALIFAGIALSSAPAFADGNFYAGLSASVNQVGDYSFNNGSGGTTRDAEFDAGFGGAARIGYDFGAVRADLEFGYSDVDIDSVSGSAAASGNVDLYTLMLNGYYDFEIGDSGFAPYINLGVGAAGADGDIAFLSGDGAQQTKEFGDVAPAGQIGLGFSFGLSESVDLIAGYGFMSVYSDEGNDDDYLLIHNGRVGINIAF